MAATAQISGHKIIYDECLKQWVYQNTRIFSHSTNERSCTKCGNNPTEAGHDACIANLGYVVNACCGHGVEEGYVQFNDGTVIRGYFTVERPMNGE